MHFINMGNEIITNQRRGKKLKMQCPVCKEEYSAREIEKHVDECIANLYVAYPAQAPKQKRQLPFEEDQEEAQHSKKLKTEIETSKGPNFFQRGASNKEHAPLAERMRPKTLQDYIGQKQVVGPNMLLQQLLSKGHILSMIFWGPPGCGKTSLASVIANISKELHGNKIHIVKLSAVTAGVNSIRDAVTAAKNHSKMNQKTIVFMDEIHRFNKLQQDIFLPHVEAGTFTLIGTTTENPSYSLNSALLSRCRVFSLRKLTVLDISNILEKAVRLMQGKVVQNKNCSDASKESSNFEASFLINESVIEWLAEVSDGDARVALNGLELAVKTVISSKSHKMVTLDHIKESLKQVHMLNDGQTNNTHHMYSALHKSIQAGNSNAGLYWLARIMAAKEDPVNIARRLIRISSEDVGLADDQALGVAVHTMHGCQMIGMPECDVLLGQCVVYLARAPKSRAMYNALRAAENIIINHKGPQPNVPLHIRDRSGQGKLRAALGSNQSSFIRQEDEFRSYLPAALVDADFFTDASGS